MRVLAAAEGIWQMEKDRKRALILINESSGIGKGGFNTLQVIKEFAGHGYESIVYPIIPGTDLVSEKILADYDGKADVVFCSGGDGTLNHVVQAVMRMENRPQLAYLPTGSTNDFARTLGIPTDVVKCLNGAFEGEAFRYDVGSLNNRYFNYAAAFGAFSAVSYATDQQLKNLLGHAAYIISAVSELFENMQFSRHMRIESDEFTAEGDYIFGAVCNSAYVAGFPVFKDLNVRLDDGKMEMLLIKTPETALDLQGILTAIQRGILDHPLITFGHISKARIISHEETAWSIDGEFGGSYDEMDISVIRQAVSIMRPVP